jgi:hypothetical protein
MTTTDCFESIHTFSRARSEFVGDISANDLRGEAAVLDSQGIDFEYWKGHGAPNTVEVLFVPSELRAGVCAGGLSDWTNASSAEDALRRYYGIDGATMVP